MITTSSKKKEDLLGDLAELNQQVTQALDRRKEWMDTHMEYFAKLQVGEEIYDLKDGSFLGVVSKLYRYDSSHNPLYDNSMNIDYEFVVGNGSYDNTSRYAGTLRYGPLAKLESITE